MMSTEQVPPPSLPLQKGEESAGGSQVPRQEQMRPSPFWRGRLGGGLLTYPIYRRNH